MPAQTDSAKLPGYVGSEGQNVQPHNWSVSGVSVQHRDNFLEQESSQKKKKKKSHYFTSTALSSQ